MAVWNAVKSLSGYGSRHISNDVINELEAVKKDARERLVPS
jgi:hypothetical protein